jgi:hypothetical protein
VESALDAVNEGRPSRREGRIERVEAPNEDSLSGKPVDYMAFDRVELA